MKDLGTCGENVLVIVSLLSHKHTHSYSFKTFLGLTHIGEVKIFQIHFHIQTDSIFQLMSSSTSVPNEVASEYMFLKSGVFFFKTQKR